MQAGKREARADKARFPLVRFLEELAIHLTTNRPLGASGVAPLRQDWFRNQLAVARNPPQPQVLCLTLAIKVTPR